jgi:hypothetical protein
MDMDRTRARAARAPSVSARHVGATASRWRVGVCVGVSVLFVRCVVDALGGCSERFSSAIS